LKPAPNHYQQASYILSAHKLNQLPEDSGIEVAFAGRSNAGKSSAINAISTQRSLARTSKTPGRTQQIVIFELDQERRIADLPGYGYAKVARELKQHWQTTLDRYFQSRRCLQGLILVMDVRHPMRTFDEQMLSWCQTAQVQAHILLTKADKLKRGPGMQVKAEVTKAAASICSNASVQLFSALKKTGVDEARLVLDQWYQF